MDDLHLTMKNLILAFAVMLGGVSAQAAGVLINGNQINPGTAISISTLAVIGAGGASFGFNGATRLNVIPSTGTDTILSTTGIDLAMGTAADNNAEIQTNGALRALFSSTGTVIFENMSVGPGATTPCSSCTLKVNGNITARYGVSAATASFTGLLTAGTITGAVTSGSVDFSTITTALAGKLATTGTAVAVASGGVDFSTITTALAGKLSTTGTAVAVASGGVDFSTITTALATKQATGNYITDLTGNVTASGPGSVAATIVSVPTSAVNLSTVTTAFTTKASTGTENAITTMNALTTIGHVLTITSTATLTGATDGTDVGTGKVGEFISSAPANGVPIGTSGAVIVLSTVTLTAGDWELSGNCSLFTGATTASTSQLCSFSTISGTFGARNLNNYTEFDFVPTVSGIVTLKVGPYRVSISGSVIYYLEGYVVYTVGGGATWGNFSNFQARRIR